ncbi:MAG: 4-hydroxy-2-oxovalerate aldolase [Candidatus Omnitrophica bacterium]|nr:4-hydroxy-2-oxovalerate aldolase [Candidatus Omnitrophota bacterium]
MPKTITARRTIVRRDVPKAPHSLTIARSLRERFQRRQQLFGGWISIGHPETAAIFARAENDFIGICMEHTTIDLATAGQIIRACHEFRKACLPRIYGGDLQQVRRLLDAGADGIIVPQVSCRQDIDRVRDAMWYPPQGARGFGVAAAQGYGRDFNAYVRGANEALSLMIQIESIDGVERIQELVTHPGVDAVMVGPYDISGSLGLPGELQHPKVAAACRRVIAACAAAGKSCGYQLVYPDANDLRREFEAGFSFLVLGSDVFNLSHRSEEVDRMIAGVKGHDRA